MKLTLLLALPASADEVGMLAEGPYWDYGRQCGINAGNWRDFTQERFAATFHAMSELIETARQKGFTVVRRAGLEDLRRAFRESANVVLMAHWRGSQIREDDLGPAWAEKVKRLVVDSGSAVGAVMRALGDERCASPQTVADRLNRAIEKSELHDQWPAGLGRATGGDEILLQTLSRDLVDEAFGTVLRKGNCLEMFDGLHGPGAIARAISADFAGTFDASCCNSSILATYLRLVLDRPLDIISGAVELNPVPHIRLLEWVLREFRPDSDSYAQVRLQCTRALHDAAQRRLKEKQP